MAAKQNANKISENHDIIKSVEHHVNKISADHHAELIIEKLREAKLVERKKILEYQATNIVDNSQTKVSVNQNIKISKNQNIKNSKNLNINIFKNPSLKFILERKKLQKAKAKRMKELLLKENEFHPDKRRRKMSAKKIVLRPKHDYRIVATTNKRKRTTPVKEHIQSPLPQARSPSPELSLRELVQISDKQGLCEEDFMEILTCPSPVWWESDEEDDFSFRLQDIDDDISQDNNTIIQEINQKAKTDDNGNRLVEETTKKTGTNTSTNNETVNKRMKLEKLLNNIKTKSVFPDRVNIGDKYNEIDELENNELNKNETDYNEFPSKDKVECNEVNNEKVSHELNKESGGKKRTYSISGLSDVSLNDELINTLENMEIPVKETNKVILQNEIDVNEKSNENDDNSIDVKKHVGRRKRKTNNEVSPVNNYEFIRKRTRKPNKKYELDWSPEKKKAKSESPKNETVTKRSKELLNSKNDVTEKASKIKVVKVNTKDVEIVKELKSITLKINKNPASSKTKIPPELPPLTKNPYNNRPKVYESRKTLKIINPETNPELDSIPDTNITFLDEYKDKSNEEVNVNKYEKGQELVTVYQIVSNTDESFDDIESQIKVNLVNKSVQGEAKSNSQIKEFFKTRKRIKKTKTAE